MGQGKSDALGRIRAPRSDAAGAGESLGGSERRLLVVDDEPDFAEIVRKVGERSDYCVEILTESPEFASAYARFQPSVIVLDIIMPEVDGIEIVQWLAANGNKAPVILTSGYNPNFAKAAEVLGKVQGQFSIKVLSKPVPLADLESALLESAVDATGG